MSIKSEVERLRIENAVIKRIKKIGKYRETKDDDGNIMVNVTLPGRRIRLTQGEFVRVCEAARDNDITYVGKRMLELSAEKCHGSRW